jgi:hypothetical protein
LPALREESLNWRLLVIDTVWAKGEEENCVVASRLLATNTSIVAFSLEATLQTFVTDGKENAKVSGHSLTTLAAPVGMLLGQELGRDEGILKDALDLLFDLFAQIYVSLQVL